MSVNAPETMAAVVSDQLLTGKVCVISGAATGIGRAAGVLFAQAGAHVVIADVSDGQPVVDQISGLGLPRSKAISTDVGDPEQVRRLIEGVSEEFGRLDVIYANAGTHEWGSAPEVSVDSWERSLRINLSGQFYLAKYGIPVMEQSGRGAIILTASEYGLFGARRSVGYCAAKAGVINLTRALAVDSASAGIRVNCVVPGPTATERALEIFASDPGLEEQQDRLILLRRNGKPQEVARVALFLASEGASFMTGAIVRVDGGATSWYSV